MKIIKSFLFLKALPIILHYHWNCQLPQLVFGDGIKGRKETGHCVHEVRAEINTEARC
jgi:hypothetical protein